MQKRASLVDQFKSTPSPPTSAPSPAAAPAGSAASTASSKASQAAGKQTVGQWFQKNWGKALAIVIVVVITTIFIVRTVLIAKNKKKAAKEQAQTQNQSVEWESFLGPNPHQLPLPPMHMPLPPLPHMPPMQPMHPMQRGAAPRPVYPPAPVPVPRQPASQSQGEDAAVVERGFTQQRLPPADGSMGAGLSIMPESSRPQNSTFTINTELPVADVQPEKEPSKKKQGDEPPPLQADVDAPTLGTEFNR